MKPVILAVASAAALLAQVNPRELVRQSLVNYDRDWLASADVSFTQRDVEKGPDGTKVSVSEVSTINGVQVEKVISRNGTPLTGKDAVKGAEKYKKAVAEANSTDLEKHMAEGQRKRDFLKEVPDAFDFKLIGEQTIAGRPSYIVQLTPKPGYEAKNRNAKMFSKMEAKLWIDKEDVRWTKAEAHVIDTICIGVFLARIGAGSNIVMEQMSIGNSVWLPKRIDVNGNAKIMMVHNKAIDEELTYSNYTTGKSKAQAMTARIR